MTATTGRVYGGLTPEERHLRRRDQLLEAGLEVFAMKGWAGTAVLDVCQTARLSQRYFYEHFSDREALFLAVSEKIADEVEHVVRAAASEAEETPEQRARGVLQALAAYFARDPRTVRVALVESFATARLRAHRAELLASFAALGSRLMRTLHPEPNRASARSLELSALVLSGGIAEAMIASDAAAASAPPSLDELVDHLVELWTAAAAMATPA